MASLLSQVDRSYLVLARNAGSLMGTTVVTSVLGFAYWWVAARAFTPGAVGLGSAAISAMMLLASVSVLGFGTLLIGELQRQRGREMSLILTGLTIVGIVGGVLGGLFALFGPALSAEFGPLARNPGSVALFALGVSLTSMATVADQALVGMLRSELQLWRNVLFAAGKLGVLWLAGRWLSGPDGMAIYAAWAAGIGMSLAVLGWRCRPKRSQLRLAVLPGRRLRQLGWSAMGHHLLNLALQGPSMVLPVLVTALISAESNAYFYTAWMVASLAFSASAALTTVLYAVGAGDRAALARESRITLKVSFGIGLLVNLFLLPGAQYILMPFGARYADQAAWSLRVLGLAVFPMIIKNHFVAIRRVESRAARSIPAVSVGSLAELLCAGAGAWMGGLLGLCLGWMLAVTIEAGFMAGPVCRTAFRSSSPDLTRGQLRGVGRRSASADERAVLPAAVTGGRTRAVVFGLSWLGVLGAAEALSTGGRPLTSLCLYGVALLGLPLNAAFARGDNLPGLLLALMVVPIIRILPAGVPIERIGAPAWFGLHAAVLLVGAAMIARAIRKTTRLDLPLRALSPLGSLPSALFGLAAAFSLAQFRIPWLTSSPMAQPIDWQIELTAAAALLGVAEAFVFCALLPAAARPVFGRWGGRILGASIFALMFAGAPTWEAVLAVGGLGLLCAWIVARTGSAWGVALALAVAKIMLLWGPSLLSGWWFWTWTW